MRAATNTKPRIVVRRRAVEANARPRLSTREAILAAAARSFADRGYHRTSLHEVAEDVGIQKASIFHHFASKEVLYRTVLEEGHVQGEAIIRAAIGGEGSWSERVRALLDAYVALVAAHPEQTKILLRQSLGDAPEDYDAGPDSDRLLGQATSFLTAGQRAGAFASFDAMSLVLGVMGMVVFFFTSAPVVAPRWSAELGEDRVEHLRRHVAAVVARVLALDTAGDAAITPPDPRGVRDG